MYITVKQDRHGEWNVWLSLLPDHDSPIEQQHESFIIASDDTRDRARDEARAVLLRASVVLLRDDAPPVSVLV